MAKTQFIIKVVLPVIILGAAILTGIWLVSHPEKARKGRSMESLPPLVQTESVIPSSHTVPVEALGQVIPARQTTLKAQVAGEIISTATNFVPGGHLEAGDTAVTIDPIDYDLAVKHQEAVLKEAEANYQLELGRQKIAREELAILERTTGRKPDNANLALRAPQLAQAKAEIERAKADLAVALLDLERTSVKMPFNGLITHRQATLGDKVQPSDDLATLVSTDEYWIEVSLPVSDLKWLVRPDKNGNDGSKAKVIMQDGRGVREGKLYKTIGTVNPQSRFADILVRIPDPLLLESNEERDLQPLIIGDYVKVMFEGKTIKDTYKIPLSWLQDNNSLWIYKDNKLEVRQPDILYEDRTHAYVTKGIAAGEEIITSDIPVPVDGMKVRKEEDKSKAPAQGNN